MCPAPATRSPKLKWRQVRKALDAHDVWDYFSEYTNGNVDIENSVTGMLYNIARDTVEVPRHYLMRITAVEDEAGQARFVSPGHTLIDGDVIMITGTTFYDFAAATVTGATPGRFKITAAPGFVGNGNGFIYANDNLYFSFNQYGNVHGAVHSFFATPAIMNGTGFVCKTGVQKVLGGNIVYAIDAGTMHGAESSSVYNPAGYWGFKLTVATGIITTHTNRTDVLETCRCDYVDL